MSAIGALSSGQLALLREKMKERGLDIAPEERVQKRAASGPAPLSLNQEGLWFIERMDPGRPTYNIPGPVRLVGKVDIAALERTLSEILRRHEVLRTSFLTFEDGVPMQVVGPHEPLTLKVDDLSGLEPDAREAEVVRRAEEDGATPFDLGRGPLVSAFVLRLGPEEHVLVLKVHHLVIDGWSWGILTREMKALYQAFVAGEGSPLHEPGLQYADFAVWQRDWLQGREYERLIAYWRHQLDGAPSGLSLPMKGPRPATQSFSGGHRALRLGATLTEELRSFSHSEGRTLFVTLMSAFNILLSHYSGQEDIVVGSTFANRNRPELEGVIGYFVTVLPIRTQLGGDPTVRELLGQVAQATAEAAAHQGIPLGKLANELGFAPDVGRNPVFQVVFYVLTPDHNPALFGFGLPGVDQSTEWGDLRITPIETDCRLARFDIMVIIWDLPDGLRGTVEYATDLFDDETIDRMMVSFELLLRRLVRRSDAKVEALREIIADAERRQDRLRRDASKRRVSQSLRGIRQSRRRGSRTSEPSSEPDVGRGKDE